jgi:hypothetical protein
VREADVTADYIAFHAIERPDAVALLHQGRPITFAEVSLDIRRLTQAVDVLEVQRGGRLQIMGRGDDPLNFGGRKLASETLSDPPTSIQYEIDGSLSPCSRAQAMALS